MKRKYAFAGAACAALVLVSAAVLMARPRTVAGRHIIGFAVPWDPESPRSLARNADKLTEAAIPAHTLDASGSPQEDADPALLRAAQQTGLPLLGIITNYDGRQFDPARAHRACGTPDSRAAFAARLVAQARARGFAGLNLDLENLDARDAAGYVALVRQVREAGRAQGLLTTVSVPVARPGERNGFNLRGLADASDLLVAMLYEQHSAGGEPGAIASRPWVKAAEAALLASVPPAKLVIGAGTYGYDWSRRPATELGFDRAIGLATGAGKAIQWDAAAMAPHFAYLQGKQRHEVWFEDAGTLSGRIADARAQGCAGLALWRLGDEDPDIWPLVDGYRCGRTARVVSSSKAMPDITTQAGEGDLLRIDRGDSRVSRQLDWEDGQVTSEHYSPLHAQFSVERYLPLHPRMVALTFDDGPDAVNTPRLLDLLKAQHAHATFFLIGQNAADNPELTRRIYAEGHDIGNHSYSHPHFESLSLFQGRLEVNLAERVIESITGHSTVLFRRPYDVNNAPHDRDEIDPLLPAADDYLICGASIDPEDWARPAPQVIVRKVLDQLKKDESRGGVIVMHDGGGDREATLAAVGQLIPALRRAGYSLVTLHEMVGRDRDRVMPSAGAEPMLARAGLQTVLGVLRIEVWGRWLMLAGVLFLLCRLVITSAGALWHYRASRRRPVLDTTGAEPLVTVLVPAYNEGKVIGSTIRSLLASTYRNLEILVIDDGSRDDTYEAARASTSDPRVRVMRKENGGKGRALNFGLDQAGGELIIAIDADTVFEPETISHLLARFDDPKVGAVAGNIKIANRDTLLTRWQHIEYVVGINLDKRFFDLLGCVPVVPGAVGAWRREAIRAVGGYSQATMAEDADLTLSVQRAGWRVVYEDRAVAWTEAPTTWSCLMKQRLRWTFGTLQCLWKHRGAFLNPRAGSLGLVGLPYVAFYHALLLAGPLVDAAFVLGVLAGWGKVMLLLSIPYLLAEAGMAALAFRMDGEPVRSIWPILLQRFGYRQMIYWMMFRSVGMACKGTHLAWQKPRRVAALLPAEG